MLNRRETGLSLIELLVGMTIGLFIVLAGIQTYLGAAKSGLESSRANRITQDLRAVLDVAMSDIRRAGYWTTPTSASPNPFTEAGSNLYVSANCVAYSYDATWNGGTPNAVDPGIDFGGIRFANQAIQILHSSTVANTTTACADNTLWENLTDPSVIAVTALTFDVAGTKCIAFDPATYNESDPTTYQSWTTTTGTTTACESTSTGAPSPFPPATNTFVETRIVRISITAQHAQAPEFSRTLTDLVTIRNHRVVRP